MSEDSNNIFGRRLNQARLMNGITMEELGKSVRPAVSRQAINKYEKGQTMPDSRMLIAFGRALGVKPDYFFRPFTVTVDRIMFQKNSRLPAKTVAAIRERVREELERYLEIEELCGSECGFCLKKHVAADGLQACEAAKAVRLELGLGMDGISNVIEVFEDNGIKVIETDGDCMFGGLSGYANDNIPLIVINRNLSTENKRVTLLHELAHLILDFGDVADPDTMENICDLFAIELLLPAEVLKTRLGHVRHDISLEELSDIQKQYGASIDTIMIALRNAGVISSRRYDGYLKKKRCFPDFNALVERSMKMPETSGRFVRMVYRAVADELISFSKAAVLLNTTVDAVKSRLQLV